ncbi:PadR family transcriptional regulator [Candidatus Bathyarchaeota archaeon]|nr:PadR family transcriptional regulator [Candidatus Bathyarchaeota archaeon]
MAEAERDLIRATVRGFSRSVILWLVSQKPMSGYAVVKEMKRLTGERFHPGIIYPLLYDLEEKGLIAGKWIKRGRRRIKRYSVTEKGTKMLNRLRELFEMPVREVLKDLIGEILSE